MQQLAQILKLDKNSKEHILYVEKVSEINAYELKDGVQLHVNAGPTLIDSRTMIDVKDGVNVPKEKL